MQRPTVSPKFRAWWNVSICGLLFVFALVQGLGTDERFFLILAALAGVMGVVFVQKLIDAYR